MGASHSIPLTTDTITLLHSNPRTTLFCQSRLQNPVFRLNPTNQIFKTQLKTMSQTSQVVPVNGGKVVVRETQDESSSRPLNVDGIDQEVVDKMVYDALVWSSIHGLVVGDRSVKVSVVLLTQLFWTFKTRKDWKLKFLLLISLVKYEYLNQHMVVNYWVQVGLRMNGDVVA